MSTIAKIKNSNLLIGNELLERNPPVDSGLVSMYPLDGIAGTFDGVSGYQTIEDVHAGVNLVEMMKLDWRDPNNWNGTDSNVTWDIGKQALKFVNYHNAWLKTPIVVDPNKVYNISMKVYHETPGGDHFYAGGYETNAAGERTTSNYTYTLACWEAYKTGSWIEYRGTRTGTGGISFRTSFAFDDNICGWTGDNANISDKLAKYYYLGALFNYNGGGIMYVKDLNITVTDKVLFKDATGCKLNGNNIYKTVGDGWGNSGVSAYQKIWNGGSVECEVTNVSQYTMFGLSNSNTNADYTTIQYAAYIAGTLYAIYENGNWKYEIGGILQIGDKLKVVVDDNVVKYYRNDTLFYTSNTTPTLPLVFDSSIYTSTGCLSNIKINSHSNTITSDGIAVQKATVNIFKQPMIDSDFGMRGGGNFKPMGDYTWRYDFSQNLTWTYHGHNLPVTSGSSYSISFDAYVSPDKDDNTTAFIGDTDIAIVLGFYYDYNKKGIWQHFTNSGIANDTHMYALYYPSTSDTNGTKGYALFKKMQVENLPYSTEFTPTFRAAGRLTFPLDVGNGNFTIIGWFKHAKAIDNSIISNDYDLSLYSPNGTTARLRYYLSSGTTINPWIDADAWPNKPYTHQHNNFGVTFPANTWLPFVIRRTGTELMIGYKNSDNNWYYWYENPTTNEYFNKFELGTASSSTYKNIALYNRSLTMTEVDNSLNEISFSLKSTGNVVARSLSETEIDSELEFRTGGIVNCGTKVNGTYSELSVSAWIFPTNITNWKAIVQTSGTGDRAFYLNNGYPTFYDSGSYITCTKILPINTWSHIEITIDSSNIVCNYINGILINSGTLTGTTNKTIDYLHLSGQNTGDGENFVGRIKDIAIFKQCRNAQQVLQDKNGINIFDQNLLGYWPLNEGTGTTAIDYSSFSNHGTLTGDIVWINKSGSVDMNIYLRAKKDRLLVRGQMNEMIGLTPELPATSASQIKLLNPSAKDGLYWLRPSGSANAFQAYCDMTRDGGGWTLVLNTGPKNTDLNVVGSVGSTPITPAQTSFSKFDDTIINYLRGSNYSNSILRLERPNNPSYKNNFMYFHSKNSFTSNAPRYQSVQDNTKTINSYFTTYKDVLNYTNKFTSTGTTYGSALTTWDGAPSTPYMIIWSFSNEGLISHDSSAYEGSRSERSALLWVKDTKAVKYGTVQGLPGLSAKDILQKEPNSPSGIYWIQPAGASSPYQVYCDMDTDGGGWTIVIKQVIQAVTQNPFSDFNTSLDSTYSIWSKTGQIGYTEILYRRDLDTKWASFTTGSSATQGTVLKTGIYKTTLNQRTSTTHFDISSGAPSYSGGYYGLLIAEYPPSGWCTHTGEGYGLSGGDMHGCHYDSWRWWWGSVDSNTANQYPDPSQYQAGYALVGIR
jgi:hypothetical protein